MSKISELDTFFELTESTVTYAKLRYEEGLDGNIKADVLDWVLQHDVMVFEGSDERFHAVIGSLHQLIEMKNESELGTFNTMWTT